MGMNELTQGVIKRLGLRQGEPMQKEEDIDSEMGPSSISEDYQELIEECFRMMGLSSEQVRIGVRSVGISPSGMEVYAAFVKVMRWDAPVVRMLSRMPLIEKRIDRRMRQSTLLRYSSFGGIWFRSPPDLDEFAATMH